MRKNEGKYVMTAVFLLVLGLGVLGVESAAYATGGSGAGLAWELPLQKVADSLSGPVAKSLCVMMIIAGAFGIMFGGDLNGWIRWVCLAAVVAGTIGMAPTFLAALGVTSIVV
ncbi:hypothetical protein FACS1894187_14850 [Synergistales bacterium]|nr:hypothetical protein FACS1894187_14850 [Synergistales bacterium]